MTNSGRSCSPGTVISTVPMIVLFFLAQRHFVEGIATTGRKG